MKYNKKTTGKHHISRRYISLLILTIIITSCSDPATNIVMDELSNTPEQVVSPFDGQPIMDIKASNLIGSTVLANFRDRLATEHGSAVLQTLKQQHAKAVNGRKIGTRTVLIKDILNSKAKTTTDNALSTHLRVTGPDGETEEFMLAVRPYVHNNKAKISDSEADNTWLALNPDRFYLQDDSQGNEMWPITLPAVNMDNGSKIEVTFNKKGFVSATPFDSHSKATSANLKSPNLMFVEPIPIISMDVPECPPSGCGGGSDGYPDLQDDNSRGDDPRTPQVPGIYPPERTYFVVESITLAKEGDAGGETELQMFVQQSDDYNGLNMPLQYRYRFDVAFREDPTCNCPRDNTMVEGADHAVYETPDINRKGIEYTWFTRWTQHSSGWGSTLISFFPLIDLSSHPEPWRLVMSDDDRDYDHFTRRQQSEFHPNIDTYNMAIGAYHLTETGFTVESKDWGSSDDPHLSSGVRKITLNNARDRMNGGRIVAQTILDGNQFEYVFDLATYDPLTL